MLKIRFFVIRSMKYRGASIDNLINRLLKKKQILHRKLATLFFFFPRLTKDDRLNSLDDIRLFRLIFKNQELFKRKNPLSQPILIM